VTTQGTGRGAVRHDGDVPESEILISVDVETSGPTPSTGSLIAIGACPVDRPELTFYRELRPEPEIPWDHRTEEAHGLTRTYLDQNGADPGDAIRNFSEWIETISDGRNPVMVGVNVSFDWMFIADYLMRYVGRNPFGIAPLDLKSLFMGRYRVERWADTSKRNILQRIKVDLPHTHNALDDARMQAQVCAQLMKRSPDLT
jgi:DNA polymerase III epsilon subunit-like protein